MFNNDIVGRFALLGKYSINFTAALDYSQPNLTRSILT